MNNYQDMNAMKTKLILTAALLIAVFSGCKKEKYLAASFGVSNTTETVYTTAARLEATFSYPGTKYVIRVDVSERQDMSEAVHYDVKVNGDRLTAEVTGLKANTTYYYRYSNDTGFGILSNEVKSFKTQSGGGSSGCFSVSPTTTVEFASGNLYWDGGAFRFEANQWSFADTWDASHVSHFKWSDAANAVTSNCSYSGGLFCASDFTVAGDSHTWRTLSKAEWDYLLHTRDNASSLRAWVTLSDVSVSGLVLLPDGSPPTASGITTSSALADAGAVFLPAAGRRIGTGVHDVGSDGIYWSSTPNEDYEVIAYRMAFDSGRAYTYDSDRDYGYAVRLVR